MFMDRSDQLHCLLASNDNNVAWELKVDEVGGEANVS